MHSTVFEIETKRRRALFKRELSNRKKRSSVFKRCYNDIVDLVGDPLQWPEYICSVRRCLRPTEGCLRPTGRWRHVGQADDFRRLLIKPNLKHAQRFKLTLFLLSNGIHPKIIMDFYNANGSLRDVSARRSVESLMKSYLDSTIPLSFISFDLTRGRWENMRGDKMY
jgi:hypothetical protein